MSLPPVGVTALLCWDEPANDLMDRRTKDSWKMVLSDPAVFKIHVNQHVEEGTCLQIELGSLCS